MFVALTNLIMVSRATAQSDAAANTTGWVTVVGRVLDTNDEPLPGARIAVEDDRAAAISDPDGRFKLLGVRAGRRTLNVRVLGFEPLEMPFDATAAQPKDLTVRLMKVISLLKDVTVTANRDVGLQRVGFTERRNLGAGHYFGPKEIEARNSPRLSHLLETELIIRRYKCVRYFVDGIRWSRFSDADASLGPDSYLSGAELAAVEVYSPQTAPGEFFATSKTGAPCASVLVWTKWKVLR